MAQDLVKGGIPTGAGTATEPKTAASKDAGTDKGKAMSERRNVNFWTTANLRLTILNAVVVAVIGIVSVYTSNLLTQAALASRVDNVEIKLSERKETADEKFKEIRDALKTDVVSPKVLELELKPFREQLTEQKQILQRIQTAVIRNPPANFSPIPDPPP